MCNVDLATGRLSLSAVDFDIPGRVPLLFQRHYRSTNMWEGDLGYAWAHPFCLRDLLSRREAKSRKSGYQQRRRASPECRASLPWDIRISTNLLGFCCLGAANGPELSVLVEKPDVPGCDPAHFAAARCSPASVRSVGRS